MPEFSQNSLSRLATCHPLLQELAKEVVKVIDCTVAYGFRDQKEQDEAFRLKRSDKRWPFSKHNKQPSLAMDLVPYVNGSATWQKYQAYYFAGRVVEIARQLGIKIRCGADWDGDGDVNDQKLQDPTHFELAGQDGT